MMRCTRRSIQTSWYVLRSSVVGRQEEWEFSRRRQKTVVRQSARSGRMDRGHRVYGQPIRFLLIIFLEIETYAQGGMVQR